MSDGTQRRLAAIVSADVVGYSRLMGLDEVGTHARLKRRFSEFVMPQIAENGGRVVKLMGDGLLAEFPSVIDAVNWAVDVQTKIAELDIETEKERRIVYRVGVNLGDIIADGDDIFGDGVNVAARLQEIAEPGGIAISGNVQEQVRDKLDHVFFDDGDHEVKNITRPVRVWRWSPAGLGVQGAAPLPASSEIITPDKPSIAVLPFDNMSGDEDQDYFVDGMTEDIITALARFHSLLVIARNSTFTYKGMAVNIAEVGKELGVRYVVEGSVRKAGDRVRITAQLIEAASSNHIWAERYDRDLSDIFALQDEITETIVSALEQEIGTVERTRAAQKRPDNLESWELLQRGLHHLWQMNVDDVQIAIEYFRQSISKDDSFAQAHSQLAFALMHQIFFGAFDDTAQLLVDAERNTREALKFDDRDSLAHEMLARIMCIQHAFDEAITEAKRAVEYNPNSASASFAHALICYWSDRAAEGLVPIKRAIQLSPKDPRLFHFLAIKGSILCETGRIDEGIEALQQSASLPHGDYRMALNLAAYCAAAGRMEEAQKAVTKLLEIKADFTLSLFKTKLTMNYHPNLTDRLHNYLSRLNLPS